MFCPNCGQQLPDTAKYCPSCGKPVSPTDTPPVAVHTNPDLGTKTVHKTNKNIQCPNCGSNNCREHYKQNVSSTGGGYGCLQGGLGFLLAGPFGLLCGLCGRSTKTTTTNTLVWVCQNCGKEFRSRADVYEGILTGYKWAVGLFILGMVFLDIFTWFDILLMDSFAFGYLGIILLIVMAIPAALCFFMSRSSTKNNYGVRLENFFTAEEKDRFNMSLKRWFIALGISVVVFAFLLILLAVCSPLLA